MKKFWTVLLAVAFVAGFAMSASAADVKFGGTYYVYGMYVDNPSLKAQGSKTNADQQAQAFYQQRLRVQTEFKIAEGLALVTRFDALEKQWGQGTATFGTGWRVSDGYDVTNRSSQGLAGTRTQENIEFERAYIDFTTKIGRFMVGYQNFIAWGTMFLDTHITRPGIKYFVPVGPLTVVAAIEKVVDQNSVPGQQTDADYNIYDIGAIYKFGAGDAGILYQYGDVRMARAGAAPALGWSRKLHIINPYAKMKFGPVYFEAEGVYGFGDWAKYDVAGQQDVSAEGLGLYLHAKGDFGPAYVGGQFVYMRGDDPNTADKREGTIAAALLAGQAYDPCLILWNDGLYGGSHRMGHLTGYAANTSVFIDNTWFYQIYGGFKPVAKADIMMSLSYAYADKKPLNYAGDVYGTEIDLVAKYKLFDNLEYMVGAAYLWTGNYYKGVNDKNQIDNNYMLIHKLTAHIGRAEIGFGMQVKAQTFG
jgi:hypothetical protein